MSYEPLHHKYRPQTFKDLVGQSAIADTLIKAIELAKIAPAYLFTGPRGTGKTSSARILAKSLNCLAHHRPTATPCGKCEVCLAIAQGNALDVVEIDAASNTGVDNIREIIERSRFAPVQSRYKVYAIDECHMLSTAAFNALLKTLEEPPAQVVFILATTDPQRVLPTIISRCQRFDYRRIPLEAMVEHLRYIAGEEGIDITLEAITLVAQIANGGLRDAESLLDQLSLAPDKITVERVWDLVGVVPERDLLALLTAIRKQDIEAILAQCRSLLDRGREPLVLLQNLASFYLNLLLAKTAPTRQDLAAITETCWQQLIEEAKYWDVGQILQGQQQLKEGEVQIKNTTQPRLWLEVNLLGLLNQARYLVQQEPQNSVVSYSEKQEVISNPIHNNLETNVIPFPHQNIIKEDAKKSHLSLDSVTAKEQTEKKSNFFSRIS
jgi:DNA polymerase III subunit gamma/tau